MAILKTIKTTLTQFLNNLDAHHKHYWTTISMVILGSFKDNYDTATTTANKSMGFDLSAT